MHKGRIEVLDSDLGGARFEVTLPLNRLGAGQPRPRHADAEPRSRPCSTASSRSCASRAGHATADAADTIERLAGAAQAGRASSSSRTTPT